VVVRMTFTPLLGAHFHAISGDHELVVGIEPLAIIQGDAPARVRYLVMEWAARHHQELLQAWYRCQNKLRPQMIAPLY
jgi:hypothetical protein